MAEDGYSVKLNIYDLSRGLARQLSTTFLGKAIEAICSLSRFTPLSYPSPSDPLTYVRSPFTSISQGLNIGSGGSWSPTSQSSASSALDLPISPQIDLNSGIIN